MRIHHHAVHDSGTPILHLARRLAGEQYPQLRTAQRTKAAHFVITLGQGMRPLRRTSPGRKEIGNMRLYKADGPYQECAVCAGRWPPSLLLRRPMTASFVTRCVGPSSKAGRYVCAEATSRLLRRCGRTPGGVTSHSVRTVQLRPSSLYLNIRGRLESLSVASGQIARQGRLPVKLKHTRTCGKWN